VLNPAVPPYPKVRFDRQGAWTQAAPARRTARTNPPLTAFSVPPDLFDYAWDPHEREEAVWRDPSSRHQVLVSNNADVIPLDEQHIATDNEEDTADPNYFPGRRRSDELDPDQSDIEDQFLARVRPPQPKHQQINEIFPQQQQRTTTKKEVKNKSYIKKSRSIVRLKLK